MDTFSYYFWTCHAAVLTHSSSPLSPAAALIRGNRNNCTQFSNNLDWLVSKLERLESSSGTLPVSLTLSSSTPTSFFLLASLTGCVHFPRVRAGILEVLHCILIESPEALNIVQRGHIKSIISLLYKHGRNHKVSIWRGS